MLVVRQLKAMKKYLILFLKVFASYTIAGAIFITYVSWPDFQSHPHVPFSSYPSSLIFSPVVPLFLIEENLKTVLIFMVSFIVLLFLFLWLPKKLRNKNA